MRSQVVGVLTTTAMALSGTSALMVREGGLCAFSSCLAVRGSNICGVKSNNLLSNWRMQQKHFKPGRVVNRQGFGYFRFNIDFRRSQHIGRGFNYLKFNIGFLRSQHSGRSGERSEARSPCANRAHPPHTGEEVPVDEARKFGPLFHDSCRVDAFSKRRVARESQYGAISSINY